MSGSGPFPKVLPPWQLTAECWLFPFWTSNSTIAQNRQADTASSSSGSAFATTSKNEKHAKLSGLPQGSFHPLENLDEQDWPEDAFRGGLGAWVLYRYTDSPAGPYDELIYIGGFFKAPNGKTTPRITNIYVSSLESVYNGRRNWNIPKHLAEFKWARSPHDNSTKLETVSIYHPSDSPLNQKGGKAADRQPFFSASLQASRLPSIPVNTNLPIFPAIPLIQPPVKECTEYNGSSRLGQAQIATERGTFRTTAPTFKGSFGLAYAKPLLSASNSANGSLGKGSVVYGDGFAFPESKSTWSFGVHFTNVIVGFPEPSEYKAS